MEEKEKRQEGHHQGFVKPLSWRGGGVWCNKTPRGARAAGGLRGWRGAGAPSGEGEAEPQHRNFAPNEPRVLDPRAPASASPRTSRRPGLAAGPRAPCTVPAVPGPSRGRAGPPGSVRAVRISRSRVGAAKSLGHATPARPPPTTTTTPSSAAARQVHHAAINNN